MHGTETIPTSKQMDKTSSGLFRPPCSTPQWMPLPADQEANRTLKIAARGSENGAQSWIFCTIQEIKQHDARHSKPRKMHILMP